jgi:hypothetical protein
VPIATPCPNAEQGRVMPTPPRHGCLPDLPNGGRLSMACVTRCRHAGTRCALGAKAGGWDTRYALTLAVAANGDVGGAFIDTNGDEADIDLDEYERDAEGNWHEMGSGSAGKAGASRSTRMSATWGRADPHAVVEIEYLGQRHSTVRRRPDGGCSSCPRQTTQMLGRAGSTSGGERPLLPLSCSFRIARRCRREVKQNRRSQRGYVRVDM